MEHDQQLYVFFFFQNVELLLQDLKFHPTELKTILDKFAAVGILQVIKDLTLFCS